MAALKIDARKLAKTIPKVKIKTDKKKTLCFDKLKFAKMILQLSQLSKSKKIYILRYFPIAT